MSNLNSLFEAYYLNTQLALKNKIIMAPLTRRMASDHGVPTELMAAYYARRADAGLIISEGTAIRPDASYPNVPGIYNEAQINGWQNVTTKVHAKGGKMFLQLWHVGRVSHPNYLGGELPISASSTKMSGRVHRDQGLFYDQSRAASLAEIEQLVHDYVAAAKHAMLAGFDGVEIHGANGYLLDQFLHYHTNFREDAYGGSPENMTRLPRQIVQAVGEAIGYERVGIRLSPAAYLNEVEGDPRDEAVFEYLLTALNSFPIAYVHTGNFDDSVVFDNLGGKTMTQFIREHYRGVVIAAGSYSFADAVAGIEAKQFDLIAIGRPFIANPNLVEQLKQQMEVQAYDNSMLENLY